MDLFDYAQTLPGAAERDAAIDRVEKNANEDWKEKALHVVRQLASKGVPFTTDDVWQALDQSEETTHERRALGAIIRKASANKLIVPTGQFRVSNRPICHRSPKRVWKGGD